MEKIEGTIKYEIEIVNNEWQLKYTQSSENDLAILAIGQQLMEQSELQFEEALTDQTLSTKHKKFFQGRLSKVRAAKFGLQIMCNYLANVIDEYKKWVAENKEPKGPKLTDEERSEMERILAEFEANKQTVK